MLGRQLGVEALHRDCTNLFRFFEKRWLHDAGWSWSIAILDRQRDSESDHDHAKCDSVFCVLHAIHTHEIRGQAPGVNLSLLIEGILPQV